MPLHTIYVHNATINTVELTIKAKYAWCVRMKTSKAGILEIRYLVSNLETVRLNLICRIMEELPLLQLKIIILPIQRLQVMEMTDEAPNLALSLRCPKTVHQIVNMESHK